MVKEYKDWLFVRLATVSPNYEYKIFGTDLVIYWNGFLQEAIPIPPGSWQIIGKGDRIDWDGIVESHEFANKDNWARTDLWYKDYETKEYKWLATPTESGLSMLRSLEMEPGTTLVLKKNEK